MPSKKDKYRTARAAKEARAATNVRTKEERESEVNTLRNKLAGLGFPTECNGMKYIEEMFARYIESGETVSGMADFKEWKRIAEITLPASREQTASILLKYVG